MSPGAARVCWSALGMAVTVLVTDARALAAAQGIVDRELAAADAAYSPVRPDAEVHRVNAAHGGAVAVSERLLDAVEAALRVAHLTDGAVDPTAGATLTRMDARPGAGVPARVRLTRMPSWRLVACDRTAGTVRVRSGARLDLGAIGKALIADRAAAAVGALGTGVLVNVGGDLATCGPAPEGGWAVRVTDDHRATAGGQVVTVAAGALATSSTTVRRRPGGGHHITDPRRGRPADGPWRTASVAALTCVDANAASTAAIVLGTRAPAWLETAALPARLVRADGAVRLLAGWPTDRGVG